MIDWRDQCVACGGRGHWIGPGVGLCPTCRGLGSTPIDGAPGFGCAITLADREAGDVVELPTGDRVLIRWHQPKKDPRNKKIVPITTFVGVLEHDFGDEAIMLGDPIPLPSSFGVRGVISSRLAGDAHDGRGDALDPLLRRSSSGDLM